MKQQAFGAHGQKRLALYRLSPVSQLACRCVLASSSAALTLAFGEVARRAGSPSGALEPFARDVN